MKTINEFVLNFSRELRDVKKAGVFKLTAVTGPPISFLTIIINITLRYVHYWSSVLKSQVKEIPESLQSASMIQIIKRKEI